MTEQGSRGSLGLLEGFEPAPKRKTEEPRAAPPPTPASPGPKMVTLVAADETVSDITAGAMGNLTAVLSCRYAENRKITLRTEVHYPEEGAVWKVWLTVGSKREELHRRTDSREITISAKSPLPLTVEVEAPEGVRYKDRAEVILATSSPDGADAASLTFGWVTKQALLAIKSSRGYEREVADTILAKAEEHPGVVFSLLVPSAIRGYVFAEGMSIEGVTEMLKGIRKARGLVKGKTTLKEVEPLLAPKVTVEGFVEGAIVEIVSGPFKGEKARVKKIDQEKEQITVELIEAVVPIPVTVRGDHVRMVEKSGG